MTVVNLTGEINNNNNIKNENALISYGNNYGL